MLMTPLFIGGIGMLEVLVIAWVAMNEPAAFFGEISGCFFRYPLAKTGLVQSSSRHYAVLLHAACSTTAITMHCYCNNYCIFTA